MAACSKRNFNELKSSLHIDFLGSWVISSENYGFLGWLNSMGAAKIVHDKLKNIK